jgi:hypothetical protein
MLMQRKKKEEKYSGVDKAMGNSCHNFHIIYQGSHLKMCG